MSSAPDPQTASPETSAIDYAPQSASLDEKPAIRDLPSHVRLWLVVGLGLLLDLWSKHWAFHELRQGGGRVLIPNVLEFHTTLNPGALFGIGRGQTTLFVIASLLALVLVLWMFAQCPARRWLTQIALAGILAGALGNMYDRVFVRLYGLQGTGLYYMVEPGADPKTVQLREYPPDEESDVQVVPREAIAEWGPPAGHVRDFIKISQKWFGGRDVWPWVFNVADMLLVGGVAILAIRMLTESRRRPADAAGAPDSGPA